MFFVRIAQIVLRFSPMPHGMRVFRMVGQESQYSYKYSIFMNLQPPNPLGKGAAPKNSQKL